MATKSTEDLVKIENQLIEIIKDDRKNWIKIYQLMAKVNNEKLYQEKYGSFTQWVNTLSAKTNYHVSTLWARYSAGNTYSEFSKRQKKAGKEVKPITEVDISPDSISLIGTISGRSKNPKYADELMDKALNHELSRQDLRNVSQKIKEENKKNHTQAPSQNDEDLHEIKTNSKAIDITAKDIIEALKVDKSWLNPTRKHRITDYYGVWTELPAPSGTSKKVRRMDAAIFENLTHEKATSFDLSIHAIEIKVSKSDLIKDHKMGEYADYGDYFWLAIPKELIDVAKNYVAADWGILVINKNKEVQVVKKAVKHNCLFRVETLTEAVSHGLQR